jgi:hypothetical protein
MRSILSRQHTPAGRLATALAALALIAFAPPVLGLVQDGSTIGTARVPRAVLADGKPLPAGTYTLRVAGGPVKGAVGQNPEESRWIEFLQDGESKGRELATVLQGAAANQVLQGQRPATGAVRVDTLRGGDYLRIWVNAGTAQYLIHLTAK